MKVSRHNVRKTGIILVSLGICLLCIQLVILGNPEHYDDSIRTDEDLPISLNQMLTNEISDLESTRKMDGYIRRFLQKWEIKGASFAVMKDEKLIYAKGYGFADEGMNDSMDVRHIMRIASVSKLITAAGIMKLQEEGKLSISDPVFGPDGILNDVKFSEIRDSRAKKITIEHLLRHRGGFTLRKGDPMFSIPTIMKWERWDYPPDSDKMIQYVLSQRLGYTPGTSSSYSNVGFLILSKVIEKVSGRPYEDFIQDEILHPSGCYDFHIAKNYYEERYPNEVRYYEPSNEPLVEHFDGSGRMVQRCYGGNDITGLSGAGAWVASPTELLKFIASIDGKDRVPDILSAESIRIMTESGKALLPAGWSKTSSSAWIRTGSLSGSSAIVKNQSNGYAWVFITNTSSWKGSRFPRYIDNMIDRAKERVEEWPERDLFEIQ